MKLIVRFLAVTVVLALAIGGAASAATIALWDYNSQSTAPTVGNGTQYLYHPQTVFCNWMSDAGNSDPNSPDNPAGAFAISNINIYAGKGIQWNVSTVGYENITLRLDAQKGAPYQTTDSWTWMYDLGSGWIDASDVGFGYSTNWASGISLDLSSIAGANNNPNFKFAFITNIVSNSSYVWMAFDMVQVQGSSVPEPSALVSLLTGFGSLAGIVWRRR